MATAPTTAHGAAREGGAAAHLPALDGFRGVALAVVVVAHAGVPGFTWGGGVGVTAFFALSGYLITRLLLAEADRDGTINLGRFYRRRAARLLPALVLLVAVSALVRHATGGGALVAADTVGVLTYLSNWTTALGGQDYGMLNHTWSLAVEEQFYVVWPLVVLALLPLGRRRLLQATIGAAIVVVLWRAHLAGSVGEMRVYVATDTRADALLAGAALATWGGTLPRWVGRLGWVVLGLSCGLPDGLGRYQWNLAVVALATVGVVGAYAHRPTGVLTHPALAWLGARSYSLYLWHVPLFSWPMRGHLVGVPWVPRTLLQLAASLVLAEASYRWVECPLRARFANPRPTRRPALQPQAVSA